MFKNNSWINVYCTKGKRLYSLDCLFCFRLEVPSLGKFGPKTQSYQFTLKFCTCTNSNMQNFMVTRLIWIYRIMWKICGVHSFCFRPEKPFLGKSGQVSQNYQFKQKFGTKTNWICGIWWWCSFFSVFDNKYLSWAKWNCLFKVKLDTKTNSNMQSSMVVSIWSVLDWK